MRARAGALAITSLTFWVGGCVAYRGNAVPHIDPSTIMTPRMERVIVYDLQVDSEVGDDAELSRMTTRALETTLRSAGADVRPSGSPGVNDTMSVHMKATGSAAAQMLSGFVSGLTWTLIPGYAKVGFALDATVTPAGGAPRQYHYQDAITLWIELFLLPFSNSPNRVETELITDMFRSLALDMQRDGLLPTPTLGPSNVTSTEEPRSEQR